MQTSWDEPEGWEQLQQLRTQESTLRDEYDGLRQQGEQINAEAESALAGRLLKWAYSACRHCDVLAAKARRKEAKKKRESRP